MARPIQPSAPRAPAARCAATTAPAKAPAACAPRGDRFVLGLGPVRVVLAPSMPWARGPRCQTEVIPTTPVTPPQPADATAIASKVSNLFHQGPKAMAARLAEMDALALTALFSPEQQRVFNAEHVALECALEGGPAVAARVTELENLMRVARFTQEGLAAVTLEVETLRGLSANFAALTARADAVSPEATPAEAAADRAEANVLRALHAGYGGVQARIDDLHELKKVARFTPEGFRSVEAELTALQALLDGVPGVTAKREQLFHLSTVARLTPETAALLQLEIDVLARVEAATAHFKGSAPASGAAA